MQQLLAENFETEEIAAVDAALATLSGQSALALTLQTIVRAVREGMDVSFVETGKELTPSQAAELLQVSRPHVMQLITRGELRANPVGRDKRIPQSDVFDLIERKARGSQDVAAALSRRDSSKRALIARAAGVDADTARQLGY